MYQQAFPNDPQSSNVVIVLSRDDQPLAAEDRAFIKDYVRPALFKLAEEEGGLAVPEGKSAAHAGPKSIIASILTLLDPGTGALLVSDDRQATLILVVLTTELLERRNWPLVEKIETLSADWQQKRQIPPGLKLNLTGSAVVGRDMTVGQRESARATEFWTVVLVVGMLLLIYRCRSWP